jgi:hypothetical protein
MEFLVFLLARGAATAMRLRRFLQNDRCAHAASESSFRPAPARQHRHPARGLGVARSTPHERIDPSSFAIWRLYPRCAINVLKRPDKITRWAEEKISVIVGAAIPTNRLIRNLRLDDLRPDRSIGRRRRGQCRPGRNGRPR